MLGALWMVYFSFGIAVFGMTPLVNVIREDLDLSKGAMGTILGAWPLVFLVAAMPSGALVDRLGLRRSLGIATVIISASALLRPVVTNFIGMFGSVALFGLGGPLVSVGAPKLISVWFDEEERALAMGITMSGRHRPSAEFCPWLPPTASSCRHSTRAGGRRSWFTPS